MIKAFIVDDEPLARDELKYLLARTKEVEVVGEGASIGDSLGQIQQARPDLVFLDIELSEESGLDLAAELLKMEPAPAIIFATAYDQFALEAFDLRAVDYILKPFDEKRVHQTIEKIKALRTIGKPAFVNIPVNKRSMEPARGRLAVTADERIVLVDLSDIIFIMAAEGKTLIRTGEHEYKISDSLAAVEKRLDPLQFIRVHRSYLVNMRQIVEIEPWFNATYNLIMKDGSKVPVSRTYVKDLKQMIGF